ncbi:MAG: hypothetical protein P4L53_25770 [Candidatus Obscuribacterales bacterium]|nr:hypothetical protein [Candidatus Obscuribacterales bacterium]
MDSINQIFEFDMLPLILTAASFVGVLVLLLIYGAVIQPICIRKGILKRRINYTTRAEAIELIDQFIAGQCLPGEVDDFTYETFEDPLVQELAYELAKFCGEDEQIDKLKRLRRRLEEVRKPSAMEGG